MALVVQLFTRVFKIRFLLTAYLLLNLIFIFNFTFDRGFVWQFTFHMAVFKHHVKLTNKIFTPDANLNFKLNDEIIHWKADYKYFSILLDSKLWCKHITETQSLSNNAVGSIGTLLTKNNHLSIKKKLPLSKFMIRLIIMYSSVGYGTSSKTHLGKKIQIFQNK